MAARRLTFNMEEFPSDEDEAFIIEDDRQVRRERRTDKQPMEAGNESGEPTRDLLRLLTTPLAQSSRGGGSGAERQGENHGRPIADTEIVEGGPTVIMTEGVEDGGEPRVSSGPTHISVPIEVWRAFLLNLGQPVMDGNGSGAAEGAKREREKRHRGREGTEEPRGSESKWMTQEDVMKLLQTQRDERPSTFDLEPPYPGAIARKPYPMGYQTPAFRKFDGSGSAREHLVSFVDDLGIYRENKELRLREFSKSLTGRAFTWYTKLRPGSVHTWDELATDFCNKFLEEECAVHIMDLGRVKQRSGEPLTMFVKRYRDKALQCKETLPEVDLVYGCIKNIEDGSQVFLSMGGITTFAELLKRAADVSESLKKQGRRYKEVEPVYEIEMSRDRHEAETLKAKADTKKRQYDDAQKNSGKNNRKAYESKDRFYQRLAELPTLPLPRDQAVQLVEEWLKEGLLRVKDPDKSYSEVDKLDPDFCFLHNTRSHGLRDCYQVKRLFYRQVEEGRTVLLNKEARANVHQKPLPHHGVNALLATGASVERCEVVMSKGVEDVLMKEREEEQEEMLAKGLMKVKGLSIALSQLGLDDQGRREAVLALLKVIKNRGEYCSMVGTPLAKITEMHANAIIFKENASMREFPLHNRPLYVEANIEGKRVRRALVDNGSGVNVIPLPVLEALELSKDRIRKSDLLLSTFQGNPVKVVGTIRVNLQVGPIRTMNDFQVVEGSPSYHILLGRHWIHAHGCVPSTLHQCVKSSYKGKDVEISATKAPFDQDEAHLVEAALYDEMSAAGTSTLAPYEGISLDGVSKGKKAKERKEKEKTSKVVLKTGDGEDSQASRTIKKAAQQGKDKRKHDSLHEEEKFEEGRSKKKEEMAPRRGVERFIAPNGAVCWKIL